MMRLMKESVRSLKAYDPPKEYMDIKLDANENPYNLLGQMKEIIVKELDSLHINRYPDTNSNELRKLLSKSIGLKVENIICGNGSDEIIQMVINAFVDKGEYVITHYPTFSMYKVFTLIAGGKIQEVATNENFEINIDEIITAANTKGAKVIFLCNPNNPTGTIFSREDIENVLEKTNAIVVVDEAYYEFMEQTVIDLVNRYEQLIVLRTLSKAFALAGARIGYGIGHEKIVELLYRVKPPYNLNIFSQLIGKVYLENTQLVHDCVKTIKKERSYLLDKLKNLDGIQVFPSHGNFILIRTEQAANIVEMAQKSKLALRYYEGDKALENCIRITVGTREENDTFINLLKKVV